MAEQTVTVFGPALELMKSVKSPEGEMLTKPFLDVCRNVLPVIDKFGSSMALVKSDVGGNISRLDAKYDSDPSANSLLYDIVRAEVAAKTAKGSSSCSNGMLWLTRAMDFLVELFRNLNDHSDWTMSQCATAAYTSTLKKYHGWIASTAFTVAMKLVPERSKFYETLALGNSTADMERFVTEFSPILAENHEFLKSVNLDDLKAS
ncbi:glycolipid transfer protein 1 [Physcomitrium patens]|uniref:Glycolipid transfer protein domain-containing protein n=2 Tax=Physcomitrium patens TaxID=3218 RepID=A9SNR1_PHYPA|nr:glycolipid transfer protein 1-like [Physcomitrium patens]PNR36193.1 hypothetical protein PHYPA_022044 [Physcomitrium patens]|eukprot:XP_024401436.1 glycolipid transfer protein 1-like [Physcomitrella patens]